MDFMSNTSPVSLLSRSLKYYVMPKLNPDNIHCPIHIISRKNEFSNNKSNFYPNLDFGHGLLGRNLIRPNRLFSLNLDRVKK